MGGRGGLGARPVGWSDEALVARDELVAELVAAVHRAAAGAGSVILLTGEAGIGKTSVARAVARQAGDATAVTWGTCTPDRSAPPFWPWRELVATASEPVTATRPDPAIGAERFARLNELRLELVAQARRGTPVVHVIEDLQWADVASVLLLAEVGTAVADAPVLVLATLRTGEPLSGPLDEALEEVRRVAGVREVPPLSAADVAVLVRNAGLDPEPSLVALVCDRTGGNPLYVTELVRALRARADGVDLHRVAGGEVPARVAELLAHRLTRLPDAVADVVVTAAVLGLEGDARTVAAARRTDVEPVLDLLEQARAARLLDAAAPGRWQFRHALVRDAVYARVPDAVRAQHHARVLDALAADPTTPPAVLARHALAAQPLTDPERAVALAARAGELAFGQHAYEEAVGWFDRALDATTTPDVAGRWRSELLVLRGEAHRHLGAIAEGRRDFLAAADLTDDPALLTRAALGYADPGADLGIAFRSEDPLTAPLLERAIAAQPAADSAATVALEARLAAELYFSDDPDRSRRLARSASERAHRLDDPAALGVAAAVAHDAFVVGQADLDELLAGSAQLLAWARSSGSTAARLTAHRARVFDLLAAGDLAGMDAEILAFRRVAEPLRAPGYLWWPKLWSAMRALLEGRHDAAEARAFEAFALGEQPFAPLALVNLSFLLFFLRREQGRLAELEHATREYAASHADIPALRVALAFLLAETGRRDEAAGLLAAIADRDLDRLRDRNWPASWFQLARAAALVGDRALAATLLTDGRRPGERCIPVSLGTACLGAADLAEAWLRHTIGDLDGAATAYASAAEVNTRLGARSWLAQTRADHARLLVERDAPGDRDDARLLADLAAAAADDIGLAVVAPALDEVRAQTAPARSTTSSSAPPAGATSGPGSAPTGPVAGPEPAPTDDGAGSAPAPAPAAGVFRRAGGGWELAFAGRQVQVPDARGLRDLAVLLARPGEAVSVVELADDPDAGGAAQGAPALDDRARRQIRAKLHELDAAVDEAEAAGDGERAALAREERQQLAEAVARDLGLGGRSRRIGDPGERARKTVSTRIRRAIAQVGRAHPELGRHLERSVDTGAWCAYRPAEPVRWTTT